MSRQTSTVLWSIAGCVLAALIVLGAVYGPQLWRAGRDLIGPIRELSRSEEALDELNQRLIFEPPAEPVVREDRLQVMLAVHEELVDRYEQWLDLVERVEKEQGESLDAAKLVLAETRDVMNAQIEVLEQHQMSGKELVWLEDVVYGTWLDAVQRIEDERLQPAMLRRVRELTREDLTALDRLEAQHGRSRLSQALRERLEARLGEIETPPAPDIEALPEATDELLWRYRDEIARLDLDRYRSIHHERFREQGAVRVTIGDEAE